MSWLRAYEVPNLTICKSFFYFLSILVQQAKCVISKISKQYENSKISDIIHRSFRSKHASLLKLMEVVDNNYEYTRSKARRNYLDQSEDSTVCPTCPTVQLTRLSPKLVAAHSDILAIMRNRNRL